MQIDEIDISEALKSDGVKQLLLAKPASQFGVLPTCEDETNGCG
jgi:hypothetical protein